MQEDVGKESAEEFKGFRSGVSTGGDSLEL